MTWSGINAAIKSAKASVFRRCYIKRRVLGTGLFETDWVEITDDVKSWGKVSASLDSARIYKFVFNNAKIVVKNDEGLFNPHNDDASLWYGYLNQQRTLVKIDCGFVSSSTIGGHYIVGEFPSEPLWDLAIWDDPRGIDLWDGLSPTVFNGLISGDILLSDRNEVTFNIRPLLSVFQDFPARDLVGWTSSGMTASQFVTMVRDQTDGAGLFLFRPFFGDTTTNWDIQTTTTNYVGLNTSGAQQVIDKSVWEVIEKLAEAENYIPYITREGVFRFVSRAATTTVAFEFHGAGAYSGEYGTTIKSVNSYGFRISKYYSRVQVKYAEASTSTSYEVYKAAFTVSPSSNPWVLGQRSFELENLFIQDSSAAQTVALNIFTEYSGLKNEIEFTTSFVPHLDILDRCALYYDPSAINPHTLWDQNDWSDDIVSTDTDLIWDSSRGDAIRLNGTEFKFIQFEIDLDKFENKFIAREV